MTKNDEGLIVFSLIRNKTNNRLRFHITLSSAKLEFSAREQFSDTMTATSTNCCACCPSDMAMGVSTMSMEYSQSQEFSCKDLSIPVPEAGFRNCVVNRKSNAHATVAAGASAAAMSVGGVGGCLGVVDNCFEAMGCGWCYAKAPIVCGCGTCKQSVHCAVNSLQCYFTMYQMFCCCIYPCVDEIRMFYPCCSNRCYDDMVTAMCCVEKASLKSIRTVTYETAETYVLGKKESSVVKKVRYDQANDPSQFENEDPAWKSFPWWSCVCCVYEFRGDCECRCLPKAKDSSLAGGKVNWVFDEKDSDEIYLEFLFRDIGAESERLAAKDKANAWNIPVKQDFIKLKLETNHENVNEVHENARRFVSQITVPYSDMFMQFDEAKADEELRKLAALNKAKAAGQEAESASAGGVWGKILKA